MSDIDSVESAKHYIISRLWDVQKTKEQNFFEDISRMLLQALRCFWDQQVTETVALAEFNFSEQILPNEFNEKYANIREILSKLASETQMTLIADAGAMARLKKISETEIGVTFHIGRGEKSCLGFKNVIGTTTQDEVSKITCRVNIYYMPCGERSEIKQLLQN